jgi:hypothetical protein
MKNRGASMDYGMNTDIKKLILCFVPALNQSLLCTDNARADQEKGSHAITYGNKRHHKC